MNRRAGVWLWMLSALTGAWASTQARTPSADDLFAGEQLHDIWIRISDRDLTLLRDNYRENTYYPADIEWNGVTVRNAGIRSQGRTSRNPHKPAFRLDFNRYVRGQEFLGLTALMLDNLWQDPSMLRERLAMLVFHRMAIPAPRVSHARIYLGSAREFAGVYGVVEEINEEFLERHFNESGGHLYEYNWIDEYRFEDVSSLDWYATRFQPKTREDDSTSALYGPVRELVRTINVARDQEIESALAPQLHVRTFITHVAIENFLSEPDGVLGGLGMNNFYLYRFEGTDLWRFIPWDKDLAFERVETPRPWDNVTENVLGKKFWAVPELRRLYLQTLLDMASSLGWVEAEARRQYAQIREAALDDPRTPYPDAQFEEAVQFVARFPRERGAAVRRLVAEYEPELVPGVSGTARFPNRGRRTPE